ncbi:hypothetical protein [Chryseobacterium pennae]|nr:hypothetical protein [Chryseobacterium pennae]
MPFSFDILSKNYRINRIKSRYITKLFVDSIFKFSIYLRILVVLFLLSSGSMKIFFLLFILQIYSYYRNFILMNAADKFSITIFLSLSIFWITNDLNIKSVALLYTGVISTFSYVFAAYHKIISPMWRNGKGLSGLFKTEYYGSSTLLKLSNNIFYCQLLSWGTIIFQFSAVIALLSTTYCLVFGVLSSLFHIFNSVALKIRGFFLVFSATLPCIYYASTVIVDFINISK